MIDDREFKLQVRLYVLEHMLARLYVFGYRLSRMTPHEIGENLARTLERVRHRRIPGLDPAQSDLACAELEEAYEQLIGVIAETAGVKGWHGRRRGGRSDRSRGRRARAGHA